MLVHSPDGKKLELSRLLANGEEPSAILNNSQDSSLNFSQTKDHNSFCDSLAEESPSLIKNNSFSVRNSMNNDSSLNDSNMSNKTATFEESMNRL